MKTFKDIRKLNSRIQEDVDSNLLEVSSEKEDQHPTFDKKIPFTIYMRRKSIRQFPNNQTVALYYSPSIDKYISIPFGKNPGETIVTEAIKFKDEKEANEWLRSNNVKTKKIDKKASPLDEPSSDSDKDEEKPKYSFNKNLYKNSMSKIRDLASKTELTPAEEGERAKHSAYIQSIHSKIRDKHPALGTAITAKTNAELKQINKQSVLAKKNKEQNSYVGTMKGFAGAGMSPGQLAIAAPVLGASKLVSGSAKLAAKGAIKGFKFIKKGVGLEEEKNISVKDKFRSKLVKKREIDENILAPIISAVAAGGRAAASAGGKALSAGKAIARKGGRAIGTVKNALGKAAGAVVDGLTGGSGSDSNKLFGQDDLGPQKFSLSGSRPSSSFNRQSTMSPADVAAQKQVFKENIIKIFENVIENPDKNTVIQFNEEQISINNTIAKKVLHVYENLNKGNQKKFLKMLNENAESFKRAVNFALRQK